MFKYDWNDIENPKLKKSDLLIEKELKRFVKNISFFITNLVRFIFYFIFKFIYCIKDGCYRNKANELKLTIESLGSKI